MFCAFIIILNKIKAAFFDTYAPQAHYTEKYEYTPTHYHINPYLISQYTRYMPSRLYYFGPHAGNSQYVKDIAYYANLYNKQKNKLLESKYFHSDPGQESEGASLYNAKIKRMQDGELGMAQATVYEGMGQLGSYGSQGIFGRRVAGNGSLDRSFIEHEGTAGLTQDRLVGFNSKDYELFGNGGLNKSYSKHRDGSYYGKSNAAELMKMLGHSNEGRDCNAIGTMKKGQSCTDIHYLGPYGTGSTSSGGVAFHGKSDLSSLSSTGTHGETGKTLLGNASHPVDMAGIHGINNMVGLYGIAGKSGSNGSGVQRGAVGLEGGTFLNSLGLTDGRSKQSSQIVSRMLHMGYGLEGIKGHEAHGMHGAREKHYEHGHDVGLAVGSVTADGSPLVIESVTPHGFGGVIAGLSSSGARGRTFKFTERSIEASLSDYNRFFVASHLFTFNPSITSTYKVVLVSTTKGYHPQLRIVEMNRGENEKYVEQFGENKDNGVYSSRYTLRKDREYLIEIGASERIDFTPFTDISTGGFVCIISSEKRSLQEILAQRHYKVMMWGKTAEVPLLHTETLELAGDGKKEGCGHLNYSITAFYNEHQESITIFFHNPTSFSNGIAGTDREAAKVEFECNSIDNINEVFQGVEVAKRIVEFNVKCRSVCDLIDMLI